MLIQRLLTALAGTLLAVGASAHNAIDIKEGLAGYSTRMILSVNHGCK